MLNKADREFMSGFDSVIGSYRARFLINIDRVLNLVTLSKFLALSSPGKQGNATVERGSSDILRAAVVMLHASLEDSLRSLAREFLPSAASTVIDKIGLSGDGRGEKFSLGKLVDYKGKTVDEVIQQAVDQYLERSNYSNSTEIVIFLEQLGFQVSPYRIYFDDLDQMMKRRHSIVHRADLVECGEVLKLSELTRDAVHTWITAVQRFVLLLYRDVLVKQTGNLRISENDVRMYDMMKWAIENVSDVEISRILREEGVEEGQAD